jgi:tetratricopeptide (TPR) repeat protein
MNGRSAEALNVHAAFVTRVRTSLDLEPSAEFLRLGGGLASDAQHELQRRGRASTAVHAPAFVGRGAVMSELMDAWASANAGTPTIVVVAGEPGSGLTRTCGELIARLGTGAIVLHGRGMANSEPFATLADVFDGIRNASGSAGAAPEALAEVARIVPGLKAQFRHLPDPVGDERSLRDALLQTLVAISEEEPVLIAIDEAAAADDATKRLFASMLSRLTGRVMVLILVDEAQRAAFDGLPALVTTRGPRAVRVEALSVADVEAMVGSMITLDAQDRHALSVRLHADVQGVPYDAREMIVALVDEHLLTLDATAGTWRLSPTLEGRALPLPHAVRERVRARLERLSPAARAIADAMGVLGDASHVSVVESVAGLSTDEAESALGELVSRRLAREMPAQPGRYELASPLVARGVAALIPPSRRQSLHARAAEVLTERDLASTSERSLLPYHLARAVRASGEHAGTAQRPEQGRWRALGIGVAAVVIIGALGALAMQGGVLSFRGTTPAADAMPILALGRITDYRENPTADLTRPLTDMLATNLGRIGRLRVVSTARMYELVNQANTGDTSAASLVRAARRAGATELIDGALYSRDGGGFRLDIRRTELAGGNITQTHSVTGATLFELADSGTARLAGDFGAATPAGSIADVTTRSLSAYRLYEQGLRLYYANDLYGAEPLLEAALREDSTFAMAAYYYAMTELENPREVIRRFQRASRLAERTSDRERLTIQARFAFLASSPTMRAIAETLVVRYPDEVEGYYFTGLSHLVEGTYEQGFAPFNRVVAMDSLAFTGSGARCEACDAMRQLLSLSQSLDSMAAAEREVRRWIRLQPQSPVPWYNLADVLSQRGRPQEAIAAMERASTFDAGRREAVRLLQVATHWIYAGDFDQADRLINAEVESGARERAHRATWYRGISYRYQGRLNEALADAKRYRITTLAEYPRRVVAERRATPPEALFEAQVLYEMGRFRAAAALFDSIARWEVGDELESQVAHARSWALAHAGRAHAAAGDTIGMTRRIDTVQTLGAKSASGRDKVLHNYLRGLLLVARGQDEAAIPEFERALWSIGFGYTQVNVALAGAYMRQRRPRDAIRVLQPIIRGNIEASNYYVTRGEAHDLLARAWDAVGDAAARDSARAHYEYIVRAWRRADTTFAARVKHAQDRIAALRSSR